MACHKHNLKLRGLMPNAVRGLRTADSGESGGPGGSICPLKPQPLTGRDTGQVGQPGRYPDAAWLRRGPSLVWSAGQIPGEHNRVRRRPVATLYGRRSVATRAAARVTRTTPPDY